MPSSLFSRLFSSAKKEPQFVSFWNGELDGITYGCLSSFPYFGARLRLYSYNDKLKVPSGIELADAREICADESLVGRYIADGKAEPAKFANLFRYLLLQKTGVCWVDCDFLCLGRPNFQNDAFVFGRQFAKEHHHSINNAVLKLPSDSTVLGNLIEQASAVVDLDQQWGVIGPELLTRVFAEIGLAERARPIHDFYPIPPRSFWKPLLPQEKKSVEVAVSKSRLLHLWHNQFKRSGYDKTAAPPKGSYLHDVFARTGGLAGFSRTYQLGELIDQISYWLPIEKAGIRRVVREIDSIRETTKFLLDIVSAQPINEDNHSITTKAWKWRNGATVAFGTDGQIRMDGHRKGVWRRLAHHPNAVIAMWDVGGWLDFIHYDGTGDLKCRNNAGQTFNIVAA